MAARDSAHTKRGWCFACFARFALASRPVRSPSDPQHGEAAGAPSHPPSIRALGRRLTADALAAASTSQPTQVAAREGYAGRPRAPLRIPTTAHTRMRPPVGENTATPCDASQVPRHSSANHRHVWPASHIPHHAPPSGNTSAGDAHRKTVYQEKLSFVLTVLSESRRILRAAALNHLTILSEWLNRG